MPENTICITCIRLRRENCNSCCPGTLYSLPTCFDRKVIVAIGNVYSKMKLEN